MADLVTRTHYLYIHTYDCILTFGFTVVVFFYLSANLYSVFNKSVSVLIWTILEIHIFGSNFYIVCGLELATTNWQVHF